MNSKKHSRAIVTVCFGVLLIFSLVVFPFILSASPSNSGIEVIEPNNNLTDPDYIPGFYTQNPSSTHTDYEPPTPTSDATQPIQDAPEPPQFTDSSINSAIAFADYFIAKLNLGVDLTGDIDAMDSWHNLFDIGRTPIYRGEVSEVEYSENLFEFVIYGAKGETTNSATVFVNLQEDIPFFYCSYTRYYPAVMQTASSYVDVLSDGDIRQLAVWLGVDASQEPLVEFLQQAELALAFFSSYDLNYARITGVRFDNEAQLFYCGFEDAQGMPFEITLGFSDGLVMPVRLR
ncbi:MAG: hypothetical protein LBC71_03970 [Oscillospiraceae bacterium]|jgi:hypothetical protein|nr:hypothetical protein [Oscillospiraceae bacterium]